MLQYTLLNYVLPILLTILPIAIIIILWNRLTREPEHNIFLKTVGYFLLSVFRLNIDSFSIPIGVVIALLMANRAPRNSSFKRSVVIVGLCCFLLSLLPIQATVKGWLYPHDQMSTYLVDEKHDSVFYQITIKGNIEPWYATMDSQEEKGRELYKQLLLSKEGRLSVTNERQYSIVIHQENLPGYYRDRSKVRMYVSDDYKLLTVEAQDTFTYFLTTERFQQLFRELKEN